MAATHKLVSSKGTLLGTITIPAHWNDLLRERGHTIFQYMPYPSLFRGSLMSYEDMQSHMGLATRTLSISRSYWPDYRDAVEMHGVTLEEFEKIPGCSFAPGAGHIRSLVE